MADNGNNNLFFTGNLQQLQITLVNPYTGEILEVDEEKNLNNTTINPIYDGGGGVDTLFFSHLGDALFIKDDVGTQLVVDIENFFAGEGGDVIILSDAAITYGNVNIYGGGGDDILWSNVGDDYINGSSGNDQINGGPGDDDLYGGIGNDTLYGASGNDDLYGGAGDDILYGGEGNDILRDDVGSNMFYGGGGHDQFYGGEGIDTMNGGTGNDALYGEGDNDILNGNEGNDQLHGGEGDDTINGGAGNDKLYSGGGNDILNGGTGSDTYLYSGGNVTINDIYDGELNYLTLPIGINSVASLTFIIDGKDLIIDVGSFGTVTILGQFNTPDSGIAQINFWTGATFDMRSIEYVPPAEIIEGTEGDDVLSTQDGDDTLNGLGGNDILNGNIGDDTLNGDAGNDTLNGGADNDILNGGTGSDLLSGGSGDDILMYSQDEIWPSGFVAWNVGTPNEPLNGERVTVNPRYRNHDGFDGGDGEDTLLMGDEGEALFLDDRYSANPFGYNTARLIDIEIIDAGGGNDIVDLTSQQFSYGDVTIIGGNGDDVLWGNDGNDIINGGQGNDNIDGAAGDDILIVGEGADKIFGRGGSDQIVYTFFDDFVDTLGDFETGIDGDILNLTDILEGFDPLSDAISDFVQLVDHGADTELHVNADGDLGGDFTTISIFEGGISDILTDLIDQGNLVLDQSVVV